jgi:methyl-accepting chemotaxis protein
MFMDAQASVQFQDISRQQIELVMQALTRLDEHARQLGERLRSHDDPGFSYIPITEHLDSLYSGYVMDQQRTTHDLALKRKTEKPAIHTPTRTRIELF